MYASAEVVECYDAKGEDVCVARFSDGAVCEAVLAEAIPESEAKLCDAVPVAEIFGADAFGDESDDDKGCVEVKLSELCARVDLDGVKRRALELRDCLFCDRAFRLRGDAAAGGLEDVEAVVLRDADLRRTLLHHAAELGRARGRKRERNSQFKGSSLGRFPLVSADFWTSDHLSERPRSVDAFPGTRARGNFMLKRR